MGTGKIIISLDHGVVCHGLHFGCLHLCRGRRWHTVDVLDKALQQMRRLRSRSASAPAEAARDSRRQHKTAEDITGGAGQHARPHSFPSLRFHGNHQRAVRDVEAHGALLLAAPVSRADAWSRQAPGVRPRTCAEAAQRGAAPTSRGAGFPLRRLLRRAAAALHVGGPQGRVPRRGAHKRRGGTVALGTRRLCALTVAVLQDLKHRNRAVPES